MEDNKWKRWRNEKGNKRWNIQAQKMKMKKKMKSEKNENET